MVQTWQGGRGLDRISRSGLGRVSTAVRPASLLVIVGTVRPSLRMVGFLLREAGTAFPPFFWGKVNFNVLCRRQGL